MLVAETIDVLAVHVGVEAVVSGRDGLVEGLLAAGRVLDLATGRRLAMGGSVV